MTKAELAQLNLDFLSESLNIDPKQFILKDTRRSGQVNNWKGVNLLSGVSWIMNKWNLTNIAQIKLATSRSFENGTVTFEYESDPWHRAFKQKNTKIKYTTKVYVDPISGNFIVRCSNTMDQILYQENMAILRVNDTLDLERIAGWFGADVNNDSELCVALSIDEYIFEPIEQQIVEPVHRLDLALEYQDGVAVFTPTLITDGEVVPTSFRWEYESSMPQGFKGKFGDSNGGSKFRVTTNSRNRNANFILSPKKFSLICYAKAVNGIGLTINVTQSFKGDLALPEFEL